MPLEITMPQLGLTMTEGTVSVWLKRKGDPVKVGEPIFEVQTDKITYTVEATVDGVLTEIRVPENKTVPVGTVVGIISETASSTETTPTPTTSLPTASTTLSTTPIAAPTPPPPASTTPLPTPKSSERLFASPKARRIAKERGIDLNTVRGTGPGGRIKSRDLPTVAPIETRPLATPVAERMARDLGIDLSKVQGTGPEGRITRDDVLHALKAAAPAPAAPVGETLVTISMTNVKQQMALRMAQAKREIPHFYETIEVDCTALVARKNAETSRLSAQNVRLTYTAFLIEAVARLLGEFPLLNARWDTTNNQVVMNQSINIGVATAIEDGLIVPVIHDVPRLSLEGIARELQRLGAAAEAKRYAFADLEGGTFTISNLGMFGITSVIPVINPPQCAILGVGAMQERLVVRAGNIRIAPMMVLVLAADHRITDGVYAARFLARLREYLETL